jgi:anthranilate phosphoribosyltransferase
LPKIAVRGVYSPALLQPVAEVMRAIGYRDALVVYGGIAGSDRGMDEASVCGLTSGVRLKEGIVSQFSFQPEECGLRRHDPAGLTPDRDRHSAAVKMYQLLAGRGDAARLDAVILNSAMVFLVRGTVMTISEGVGKARDILLSGKALVTLKRWVEVQNSDPSVGLMRLATLARAAG